MLKSNHRQVTDAFHHNRHHCKKNSITAITERSKHRENSAFCFGRLISKFWSNYFKCHLHTFEKIKTDQTTNVHQTLARIYEPKMSMIQVRRRFTVASKRIPLSNLNNTVISNIREKRPKLNARIDSLFSKTRLSRLFCERLMKV